MQTVSCVKLEILGLFISGGLLSILFLYDLVLNGVNLSLKGVDCHSNNNLILII